MAYILTFIVVTSIKWGAISIQTPHIVTDTYNPNTITIQNVIMLTNRARLSDGDPYLRENSYLDQLAQTRVEDLASHDNFSHIDSQGKHSYEEVNTSIYPYIDFGENLAVLFTSAPAEETAWENSPEHAANIFNHRYQDIGVGIVRGEYEGIETTWVAVEFGDD